MVLAAAAVMQADGQTTAGDMFVNAPAELLPMLPRNTRLDMIDYFKSSLPNASANLLQGKSRITALSADNVEIDVSGASSYQLALLPMGKDTVAVFIETYHTPVADSSIRFVTRGWEPVAGNLFEEPVLADWLSADGKRSRRDVEDAVPFILAEYRYDPSTRMLTVTNNTESYFPEDEYGAVAPLLRKQLLYSWNGKRMVPVKNK